MAVPYLSPEAFTFLKALRRNNNRDWFMKNKIRYDSGIKAPMLTIVDELGRRISKVSPHFDGHLFRIYRDVRFSEDKSPYKTHIGAHFSHRLGSEKVHAPGFYLHLEPGKCFFAAGMWHPDGKALARVRNAIVDRPGEWEKMVKKLKVKLEGSSLKRSPPGYAKDHIFIKDIMRKDYIASIPISDKDFTGPQFWKKVDAAFRQLAPLVEYLAKQSGMPY